MKPKVNEYYWVKQVKNSPYKIGRCIQFGAGDDDLYFNYTDSTCSYYKVVYCYSIDSIQPPKDEEPIILG